MANTERRFLVNPIRPATRDAGFTLLEVMIYLAILGVITVPILMAALAASRSAREGDLLADITERNRVACNRIAEDFTRSIGTTKSITNFGKTLTFSLANGFDGTAPITGDTVQYSIQDDPDDANNGVDDNGNGLIDEDILVRTNTTTGQTNVIATSLDSTACSFVDFGNGVQVTVSTLGWTRGSDMTTRMANTVICYPRN